MALGRAGSQAVPAAVHNHFRAALTLGSSAGALRYYAADVVAVAYRRSFHELAATMAHAAAEAAEDQLFPDPGRHGHPTAQRDEPTPLTPPRPVAHDGGRPGVTRGPSCNIPVRNRMGA
ncbi:hypothetical protein GS421_06855 [Rhodococcus hoagii]|nr:hypothetical protein [Prescottella equi]